MKKTTYEKPTCRVVVLQHKANILVGSPYDATPPNEIPDYDDWFGVKDQGEIFGGDSDGGSNASGDSFWD